MILFVLGAKIVYPVSDYGNQIKISLIETNQK